LSGKRPVLQLAAAAGAAAMLTAACASAHLQGMPATVERRSAPSVMQPVSPTAPPAVAQQQRTPPSVMQLPPRPARKLPPPVPWKAPPPAVQANPAKVKQAAPAVNAVKRYFVQNNCYPDMARGGAGVPPGLKSMLDKASWPAGFVYETLTPAMGWQLGAGVVYYVDVYYPGDTPAWNGPGSGRIYIVYNQAVETC